MLLVGRSEEQERIDRLLEGAKRGESGVLVLRGEAGIGKTSLLDHAIERATSMAVARASGVESEAELEYAGLHDVCRPLLGHLDALAEHQRDALHVALGLAEGRDVDRFAVGAATLSLIAAAAEAVPLLVVVDDAHWLDAASVDALLFATRRLQADRVAVLYATRSDGRPFAETGFPALMLTGLGEADATRLLRQTVTIAPEVADRLFHATGGNPLALLELPRRLSNGQLAGSEPLDDPLPAGTAVEAAFAGRARLLPRTCQEALLVVAASSSSAPETIVGALPLLGLDRSMLEPAEDAGLLHAVDGRLEFMHPLVRSAVYHAAAPSQRRAAHRALADACDETRHEERGWHLAATALGPDEEIAAALEHAAGVARRRSGYSGAATALHRAAQLSSDPASRLRRLAAAADCAWRAGRVEVASRWVRDVLTEVDDGVLKASVLRLYGAIDYFTGTGETAAEAFQEASALVETTDRAASVSAAADAVNALVRTRQNERALDIARRARSLVAEDGSRSDFEAAASLGYALCFAGRYLEAETHLQRATALIDAGAEVPSPLEVVRLTAVLAWLGRYDHGYAYLARLVAHARTVGAVGSLPYLLAGYAWQALHAGRWSEAEVGAGEARALADELGQPATVVQADGILTWVYALRGDEVRSRAHGEETRSGAGELGYRLYGLLVSASLGILDLSAGRLDAAIVELEEVGRYAAERELRIPGVAPQLELAEAFARAGRVGEAEALLERFDASELVADPFLLAAAKRCRGLLADDDAFAASFEEALELHARVESPFARARTQLCFGERLRRAGRRRDARAQLHSALEVFERLGAARWAERARSELRSSGARLRRSEDARDELTPQELQVALQVAEGKTNKEVAAAMFLSPKTIEFHLARIFRKLGVSTRTELARRIAVDAPANALA